MLTIKRLLFIGLLFTLYFQSCKNQQATGTATTQNTEKANTLPPARFTCLGTEPFWYVKIEPDSGIIYNRMDEGITRYPYQAPRMEGNKTIFETSLSGSKLKITIEPKECSDNMSDQVYPYASAIEKDETLLSGCAK